MGVGFSSYDIARSGMNANERSLHVIGHNIANVNTPGYVRQQAIIEDAGYIGISGGRFRIGLGANIQEIRQIRYDFLDNLYRQENTTLGYLEAKAKTLEDVEYIMGEPMDEGFQNIINQFWDSWQELAKDPNSLTARALVRQRGDILASHINHIGNRLTSLRNDLNEEIRVRIDEVNKILKELAVLNGNITEAESGKDKANDYRDKRNLLLDRLSELVDVDIAETPDGQVTVMSGGYFLLHGTNYYTVNAKKENNSSYYVPEIAELKVEVPLNNGVLKGLIESRDVVIPEIENKLNNLINTIVNEINALHKSGKTLNGLDGQDFFVKIDDTLPPGLGNIKLNNNLVDLNNIVSSSDGSSGNNTVAYKIANLRNQRLVDNDGVKLNFDDYYHELILYIGHTGNELKSTAANQRVLVNAVENSRQSVMGVSLDEEMSNMIKYKFAYNASSKVINVVDQMIENIISRMGVVGR